MDYKQSKATFAEDLKTNLQKQEIEVDVNEHYIEKLNDSYDALNVTPKGSSIGIDTNFDGIFHAVERRRGYGEVPFGATESLRGGLEHMSKLQVSDLTNYAETKNKLVMGVVSAERNAGTLQNVLHEQMEDIVVVYHLVLDSSEDASSTVLVTNDLMDKFGITYEQLHNDAVKNTPLIRPAEIEGMGETLNEMQDGPILELGPGEILFVTSVPDRNHGAAVIVYPNSFEDAAERLGGNYFIISSSIHEVLLVKNTDEMNVRGLVVTIKEINATEVAPEDVLTDHTYHYDSKEHIFELADEFEGRQAEMEATGPEEDRGPLIDQLNAEKEGITRETPKKATKDTVRKSRGGKAL